jgi:hypothetical protein
VAKDLDPGVDRLVGDGLLDGREHRRRRRSQPFEDRREIIHRDAPAPVDRRDLVDELANEDRIVRCDRGGDPLDEDVGVAQQCSQRMLVVPFAQPGIPVDRDLEPACADLALRGAEARGGFRVAGGHVAGWQPEGGIAHDWESSVRSHPPHGPEADGTMAGMTEPTTTRAEPKAAPGTVPTGDAPGKAATEAGNAPVGGSLEAGQAPRSPASGSSAQVAPGDRRPAADGDPASSRRLEAPPSQRYVQAARGAGPEAETGGPSLARGALIGSVVALFLAAVLAVLGGAFDFTAGLIVVAVFLGRLTAVGVNSGAGDAGSPASRLAVAVIVSLAAIAVAQVGLWAWADLEGGSLGLFDFLGEVYGPLVPLEFLLAGGTAWLSSH